MVQEQTVAGIAAGVTVSWSLAVFGVPLPVVLAAFAGAMVALTFMQMQGPIRALLSVASGTVGGAYLAPFAIKLAGALLTPPVSAAIADADKPVAFLFGLGFQVAVPAFFAWIQKRGGQ